MAEIYWMVVGIYMIWAWIQLFRDAEYEFFETADEIISADLSHHHPIRGELAGHWLDTLGSYCDCDWG